MPKALAFNPKRREQPKAGTVIGKLTIISSRRAKMGWRCLCLCSCGQIREFRANHLLGKWPKYASCKINGCRQTPPRLRHGHARAGKHTVEHNVWSGMLARCDNPNSPAYNRYGGRGICVCERWKTYENFFADMGKRPPNHTLERIDNSGNYEPGNCKWATAKEQARNRRSNRIVTFSNVSKTLQEWIEMSGLTRSTVKLRLARGWNIEDALTAPRRINQYG